MRALQSFGRCFGGPEEIQRIHSKISHCRFPFGTHHYTPHSKNIMSLPNSSETESLSSEYSSHRDQFESASPSSTRVKRLEEELNQAFEKFIKFKEVAFICFGDLNAEELAQALCRHPLIVKPILTCVNVAGRAIKRDLGINVDTYGDSLSLEQASLLAGFIKPILPDQIAIPALMELDRFFLDR